MKGRSLPRAKVYSLLMMSSSLMQQVRPQVEANQARQEATLLSRPAPKELALLYIQTQCSAHRWTQVETQKLIQEHFGLLQDMHVTGLSPSLNACTCTCIELWQHVQRLFSPWGSCEAFFSWCKMLELAWIIKPWVALRMLPSVHSQVKSLSLLALPYHKQA